MSSDKITQFLDKIEDQYEELDVMKLVAVARAALKFRYQRFGTPSKPDFKESAKQELDKAFKELIG